MCALSLHAEKPEDKLTAADFFPNGNAIAAGGQGQTTYMWDIRAIKVIAGYRRNNMKVTGVQFSKSGRAIYVSHEDGRIIIWDTFGSQENQKYAVKHDAHFVPSDLKNPKSGASPNSQITVLQLKPDGKDNQPLEMSAMNPGCGRDAPAWKTRIPRPDRGKRCNHFYNWCARYFS